jgi:hypothetical protein
MIEPKIEDRGKRLSKSNERASGPNDCTCYNVIPVVDFNTFYQFNQRFGEVVELSDVDLHLSMVRAPEIKVAPSNGAKNRIIFQYAGLWALITLSCALKYSDRNRRPAQAAVE